MDVKLNERKHTRSNMSTLAFSNVNHSYSYPHKHSLLLSPLPTISKSDTKETLTASQALRNVQNTLANISNLKNSVRRVQRVVNDTATKVNDMKGKWSAFENDIKEKTRFKELERDKSYCEYDENGRRKINVRKYTNKVLQPLNADVNVNSLLKVTNENVKKYPLKIKNKVMIKAKTDLVVRAGVDKKKSKKVRTIKTGHMLQIAYPATTVFTPSGTERVPIVTGGWITCKTRKGERLVDDFKKENSQNNGSLFNIAGECLF